MNRSIFWVMVFNGLVAVFAFFKDMMLARYAGTSAEADAFAFAFFLTDATATNWLAASLGTAGVAIFAKLGLEGDAWKRYYIWKRTTVIFLEFGTAVAIVLLAVAALWLAPGLSAQLTYLMTPIILFFTCFATVAAYLQAADRFVVPAAAPLIMHSTFLAAAVWISVRKLPLDEGMLWLAVSVSIGALGTLLFVSFFFRRQVLAMSVSSVPSLRSGSAMQAVKKPPLSDARETRWLRDLWHIFGAYSLLVVSAQAVLLWERGLALSLDTGVVSSLNYAYRISQVPVWVFATAIATVMLPKLSALWMDRRLEEARSFTLHMLQLVVVVTLPVMLCLWLLSEPVVAVLFERGAFGRESVLLTAALLRGYAFSLLGHSISAIFIRYWLASGKTVQPAGLVLFSTLATALLQLFLVQRWGALGIGYGAAIGASIQGLLLSLPLLLGKSRLNLQLPNMGMVVFASVLLSLVLAGALRIWQIYPIQGSEGMRILFLFLTLSLGLSVYLLPLRKLLFQLIKTEL